MTIEDMVEPYLLQLGYVARTPRGRICLRGAYEHLGYKFDEAKAKQYGLYEPVKENDE